MLAPGATIGIIGGGQLGRMTAMAAARLGYRTHIMCLHEDDPAAQVASHVTVADYHEEEALAAFARSVDVVTFEFENIPSATVEKTAQITAAYPSATILHTTQHRLREKNFIRSCGIATAPFRPVASRDDLTAAISELGLPAILKTCESGYDGKGQWRINRAEEAETVWEKAQGHDAILEAVVPFRRELSVIAARGQDGAILCYPAVENDHRNHVLATTHAPADGPPALLEEAERIARTLAEKTELVGLLAVELFEDENGQLLVNELAPRPHNSGHWTIDAALTSQFEQLVRALAGLPLGATAPRCRAVMHNFLGEDISQAQKWLQEPRAFVHLYGKSAVRPGRKMGHVTVLKDDLPDAN